MAMAAELQDFLSLSPFTYKLLVGVIAIGGSLAGIVYLLRRSVAGAVCQSKAVLSGKTVIITGGNTGIGKATAVDLARRDARVILACRSVEKGEKAVVDVHRESGSDNVIFHQLDLASLASIRQFVAQILEEEPRIDILINNAGIFGCPYWKTKDGFEMQFRVNHLGHFLLTNLLLDRIKEAPAARIVNMSSSLHKRCEGISFDDLNMERSYNPQRAYAHSKLATILFIRALARRLEGTKVTVNVLHPGIVRTDLGRHMRKEMALPLKVHVRHIRHSLLHPYSGYISRVNYLRIARVNVFRKYEFCRLHFHISHTL